MVTTFEPKPNHPNGSVQTSQDPEKARQVRSNMKVVLIVFFDCNGVVHHEFLPQDRRVNKEYYLKVIRQFREVIRMKSPWSSR